MSFQMPVLGDSAIWGQGLVLEHQFAPVAAKRLAGSPRNALDVLPEVGDQPGRGHPRSGAKLRPAAIAAKAVNVIFPTGAFIQASPGDQANFALNLRTPFSDQDMRDFPAGTNDKPVGRLFGKHPEMFPAVTEQLLAIRQDQKTDGPVRAFAAILSSPTYQFVRPTFLQPRRAMVPGARVPGGR